MITSDSRLNMKWYNMKHVILEMALVGTQSMIKTSNDCIADYGILMKYYLEVEVQKECCAPYLTAMT